ncbi:MAG: PRD domain-containing protein, partial [Clostridiales bacterium]|nr:PRD domain-containing protein [Clostridiales bacterium]
LGIGFKKKPGGLVPEDKVEQIYRMDDNKGQGKLEQLFSEIPIEYITVCSEIIDMAEETLGKKLNKNIQITLTDHISFAIERSRNNLAYKNALLNEIMNFYPVEYEIGKRAIKIIEEKLGEALLLDEAGFIALHIVNAELDTSMSNMVDITELMQAVVKIAEKFYDKKFDVEGLDYSRFITHMKFFGQRLFKNKMAPDDEDSDLRESIKAAYGRDYSCAVKIRGYISSKYNKSITEEEMAFLTIHLRRISKA